MHSKNYTLYSNNPKMGKGGYASCAGPTTPGFADGGQVPLPPDLKLPEQEDPKVSVTAGGGGNLNAYGGGARMAYKPNKNLEIGVSGQAYGGKSGNKRYSKAEISGADVTYRKNNTTIGVSVSKDERDKPKLYVTFGKQF
jgi:hypothetical protein